MSWVLSSRDTGEKNTVSFSSTRCQERLLSKTLKSRSEVAAATLELIKKEQRRTQASLVYLRKDGAKDYKTKVLQDFLRQEGISHEVTERYCYALQPSKLLHKLEERSAKGLFLGVDPAS